MIVTRTIAIVIFSVSLGVSALQAQTLRNAPPPAEFPPASYKGKQYVDSRGCIYIRAGIDGNVTWVPRVGRNRKQICGYKPTAVAGATTASKPAPAPMVITVAPSATQPAPKSVAKSVAKPVPKAVAKPAAAAKPRVVSTTRTTTYRPATATTIRSPMPTIATTARPARVQTVPRSTTVAPAAAPVIAPRTGSGTAPAARGGRCPNASAFSQRFINKTDDVRCGPQAEPPVTYGTGRDKQSSLAVDPNTRTVPRHVYDNRQNTRNVSVPEGYKTVWTDDRLNPYRAERTLQPSIVHNPASVPPGYRLVDREDDRLNLRRASGTAGGDAQMDQIWTRTVPRTLAPVPTDRPVIAVASRAAKSPAEAKEPLYLRLSTRSAPQTKAKAPQQAANAKRRYVRVATYGTDAEARRLAQTLAGTGLPMRLGSVRRGSATYRVVLAGPFTSDGTAQAALQQVRSAGFSGARLSR